MLPSISIIIPTFHEAENLPLLVEKLALLVPHFTKFEVIIVDDNSQDNSSEILSRLSQHYTWLRYYIRKENPDLSLSVLRGLKQAAHETLVVMDADLSHDPTEVIKLVTALTESQADFALGSRFIAESKIDENWPFIRRCNAWVAKFLARNLTQLNDPLSGFFCIKSETFKSASTLSPIGYKIALELMVKCHCQKIIEVPIHFHERCKGSSKLNLKQQINYLRHLFRLYRYQRAIKHG
ncbi:MAG: hypothetical protein A3E87_01250 [Gammaproteobacteria bacterium RIFCSPHIGHO2_12_FULL_35_23]|nr:MAG: hypothetical protein A3E87_01250 [Gammaproteobacteria bacterium RIFCSPHIGHO2_12_FULL_35_23]